MKKFTVLFLLFLTIFSIQAQDCKFRWQNPLPQGNTLNSVKYLSNGNILAVGNFGTVLKSVDGVTWNAISSVNTTKDLNSMSIIGTKIWAAGSNGTVLKSTDNGESWELKNTGISAENNLNSIYFVSENVGWAVGNSNSIYKTINGGTTWTAQTYTNGENWYGCHFINEYIGWIVGAQGLIIRTTNGGATWTNPWTNNYTYSFNACFFLGTSTDLSNATGWAVTSNGKIFKTTDGGNNWALPNSMMPSTSNQLKSVFFIDANTGWAFGNGKVYSTINGGTQWSTSSNIGVLSTDNIKCGVFQNSNNGVCVGEYGLILTKSSSSTVWNNVFNYNRITLNGCFFINSDEGWAVGNNGNILHIENGGTTITSQSPPATAATATLNKCFFVNSSVGWAVGNGGIIINTTNGGVTWSSQTSGVTQDLYACYFISNQTGWAVGKNGKIIKTINGGATWTEQTSNAPTTTKLNACYFNASGYGLVAGNTGYYCLTSNGGMDWSCSQIPLFGADINAIQYVNSTNIWAVCTSNRIIKSTDNGSTWSIINPGGDESRILRSCYFSDATNGWVFGDKGTIIKTNNGGTTWTAENEVMGITNNNLLNCRFTAVNNGWVVGSGGTIIKYSCTVDNNTPSLITNPVQSANISTTTAIVSGEITNVYGSNATQRGFCWGTAADPTIAGSNTTETGNWASGVFTATITGLTQGVTYYVRAYAINSNGVGYGENRSFTTLSVSAPVLDATIVSNITSNSAKFTSSILSTGSAPCLERGFCWSSTNNMPTVNNCDDFSSVTSVSGFPTGSFEMDINNLTSNTTYYVRSYAVNSAGHAYGAPTPFYVSGSPTAPIVNTMIASDVTISTAVLNGTIISFSGYDATQRGFCWTDNLSILPTRENSSHWEENSPFALGDFSHLITNLEPNKTYYFRAYAINQIDIGYGNVFSFQTSEVPPVIPSLIAPQNGSSYIATMPNFRWNAVANALSYSIQVAEDNDFAIVKIDRSNITSTSHTDAIQLEKNKTYYWRVKAVNSTGESDWSGTWSFTTGDANVPESWIVKANNWNSANIAFDPSDYEIIIGKRTIQSGDIVGAFYEMPDGERRCAGYLIWDGNNFGWTVWGDNEFTAEKDGYDNGEKYYFKFWDGQKQREYPLVEWYKALPDRFTPFGLTLLQKLYAIINTPDTIQINQGWNLISSNVTLHDSLIINIVQPILQNLVIIKALNGMAYWPPYMNTLTKWDSTQAYAVYANSACALIVYGVEIEPANAPLELKEKNWYWIPYYPKAPEPVTDALQTIASKFIIIKNIRGEAYWPPYMNTLSTLNPGEGYQIYMSENGILVYPDVVSSRISVDAMEITPKPAHLLPELSQTGSSANLLVETANIVDGSEIGVFNHDGLLVGSGVVKNNQAAMTVWGLSDFAGETKTGEIAGSNGERLTLKYYDSDDGKIKDLNIISVKDMISGSSLESLVYSQDAVIAAKARINAGESNELSLKVYPNPVETAATIDFTLPEECSLKIELYDMRGELVRTLAEGSFGAGMHSLTLNVDGLANGAYRVAMRAGLNTLSLNLSIIK